MDPNEKARLESNRLRLGTGLALTVLSLILGILGAVVVATGNPLGGGFIVSLATFMFLTAIAVFLYSIGSTVHNQYARSLMAQDSARPPPHILPPMPPRP